MKKFLTMAMVLALLAVLPTTALAQNGYYTWSVSGSPTDPFDNNPANPGPGLQTLYLWFVEGCHPADTGGMSAAEFKLVTTGWTIAALLPQNSFLEVGPSADATGKNVLMAVGGCPTGPIVAANLLVTAVGAGRVGFASTDAGEGLSQVAATIECSANPVLNEWPSVMRCIGYATQDDGSPNQDHGQDCNVTPVDSGSWGQIKGLYR